MSDPKWTKEQLAAIETRGRNLLVAAAAGAGKTAVLVERIIRMITDPVNPVEIDKLLVVTFTNAAAAEMRERIGLALSKALNANPRSGHLSRQLALLNRASITTLHSFCLDLLRRYFYQLDLDPSFRVADEVEAELLRLEVLEELFEQRYNSDNTTFTTLVDAYGGPRDDAKLQDLVLELYRFSGSHPWPKHWLSGLADGFAIPQEQTLDDLPWINQVKEYIGQELDGVLGMLKQAALLARQPGGPEPYSATLAADIVNIQSLRDCCGDTWDKMYLSFADLKWGKLKPCKGEIDEALKERVKGLRDKAKERVKEIAATYFYADAELILRDLRSLAPLIQELAQLTIDFMDLYRQKKQAKGLVDFADLEHYCLAILLDEESKPGQLVPSPVARELQEQFAEVLVDEYQDINGVQETILQLVAKPHNRFMVGDVKQSIYRFRLAEPGLFLSKYQQYGVPENGAGCRVDLTKNFRSRSGVVNAVNFVFRQIMTRGAGEVDYDAAAELRYGADFPPREDGAAEEPVELYLIDRKEPEVTAVESQEDSEGSPPDEELEELDADQAEARLVGRRILEMVKGTADRPGPPLKVWDKHAGCYRPVTYRDIVILLRATTGRANTFLEELRSLGIPTYADLSTGYFEAIEVETFLSLLKVIDNPRQDVPLAAVLRSPMVGLKAADLAAIRLCAPAGDFYDAVRTAAGSNLGEVSHVLASFLENLARWRTQARRGPLADLIWTLYRETGYYDYVGGMVGGTQRQANLRVLYHRAKQYEGTSLRGLFRFLRFVERLRDTGSDLGSARSLSENEDVVRIMSIHKSKGLEFPVVFVAGLGKQFNLRDLTKDMLMHKEMGVGPQIIDLAARVSYPSLPKLLIRQRIKRESVAEEMRVLYVALTRAREKLILVGSVRDLAKSLEKWCGPVNHPNWPLPDGDLLSAKTCLDWLCPAVARHRAGRELLKLAGCEAEPVQQVATDASSWSVQVVNMADMQGKAVAGQDAYSEWLAHVRKMEPLADNGYLTEIDRRLGWRYPWSEVTARPAKVAVTEIKRRFDLEANQEEDNEFHRPVLTTRPRFLQQHQGLTAAERGSAIHLVMQHIPLDGVPDEEKIDSLLQQLIQKEILTPEQAAVIDPRLIIKFFTSPIGRRVLQAPKVKRELPFSLTLPAIEVYPDLSSQAGRDELVLVQGVIDCLVDEGDGLLLIDYKSDKVWPGQQSPVDRYRGQMNLYTRAVEDILGRRVKERVIYLFENGEILNL
ncbi:helicase-exonuclease AddAB subunit AddA [Desulfotomaculum nigrificans]|uniref:helicase-exonuclease AddAB subunit AddA n=1 Tax=Desulfotomaculum nigrificans TaxID=1565 RepID=UPI0001FADE6D|nr:helicase-exonuclease AddAB subunit AddA [Desulfotomaculum nigrificans]